MNNDTTHNQQAATHHREIGKAWTIAAFCAFIALAFITAELTENILDAEPLWRIILGAAAVVSMLVLFAYSAWNAYRRHQVARQLTAMYTWATES